MSRFKRENRYVVFKRKNLSHAQGKVLRNVESELWPDGNVKECLVVEHDWPCYDAAWNMIVELSKGEFSDPYAEIKQLKQRCAELENALSTALSDKTLDLVRCGIGGNYSGTCYDEAIEKYHAPLVQMKEQLRKGQE